jgi:hypothetical protein
MHAPAPAALAAAFVHMLDGKVLVERRRAA